MKPFTLLLLLVCAMPSPVIAQESSMFLRWEVDSTRSTVGFDATSTLHDFTGICNQVGGGAHASLNALTQTAGGTIWCRANGLNTDNDGRDENMFENLGVAEFPKIIFSISSVKGVLSNGHGTLTLAGAYSIHGISKDRSFPIDVSLMPDGSLHVTGRSKFLLSEHQVVPESVMGIIGVDDEVEAWLNLFLIPKTDTLLQVTHFPIHVTETVSTPGIDTNIREFSSQLYTHLDASFLDFEGVRSVSNARGTQRTQLHSSITTATWESNEQGFLDSRARMERLQAKYEQLPASKRAKAGAKIKQTVDRLKETLSFAPQEGAQAEIVRDGTRTIIRLGSRDWITFENLAGGANIPGLFATLPDVPKEVQRILQTMTGTPSQVFVHSATAAGTRELVFHFGTPSAQGIPAWNFQPAGWLKDLQLED